MTRRPLVFGEVLVDRFPDGTEVLGGAPFNVAWNLRGLGLDPLLVSRVGRDPAGEAIVAAMSGVGLDISGIQWDDRRPTGSVEVSIRDGEPSYDIVADRAYDAIEWPDGIDLGAISVVVHGSLALRRATSALTLERLLAATSDVEPPSAVFFDVNLRPPWWQRDTIERWWQRSDELKLNQAELEALTPGATLDDRARWLLEHSGARMVHVTQGERGASLVTKTGILRAAEVEVPQVVDAVGAGDAFSAVLIAGGLHRWSPELRLERARTFAAAVVGIRGATTPDPSFYARFRKSWSLS
jgi:fructokinase